MNLGVAAAFAAGVVSVASPCVLPLLPSYLSHLAGTEVAELRRGTHPRALARALLFVAGFGTVFVALGVSASLAGGALGAYQPFLEKLGGIAVVVFGLQLLGVWRGWVRAGFGRRAPAGGPAGGARPPGCLGSAGLGVAFALCWTPCVGPLLASMLVLAGQSGTAFRGAELLAAYAAGMGVPFLAAALSLGWFLGAMRRLQPWLPRFERLSGALLVALGLVLYFGAYARLAGLLAA